MPRPLRDRQQFGIGTTIPRNSRRANKHGRKFRGDGTANLTVLPDEILLELTQYLYLPDLEALSGTCKHFHRVFSGSLLDEQAYARENLRDVTLTSDNFGFHDLLLGILKREINPNYIKRFDCRETCISRGSFAYLDEGDEIEMARYVGWTPEDVSLIRAAILRSPWLENITTPDELINNMLQRAREISEDAILALLVPLMRNLALFLPPRRALTLRQVFVKIARAQIVAERTNPHAWQRLPLRRLHTIYASGSTVGMTLNDTIHYMSLPSIRRIFLDSVLYDGPFRLTDAAIRSLTGIPRSRASAVYIRFGSLSRNPAELFANYLAGPCILRQHMSDPVPTVAEEHEPWIVDMLHHADEPMDNPISLFWDHCTVRPGRDEDFTSPIAKNWASEASRGFDDRLVEFELKYRAFHHEFLPNNDMEEYEAEIRRSGTIPSPQWLALTKWDHCLIHPEKLDDDNFTLEV